MIQNRKARHLYHLFETWEAGLCLRGLEVKALKAGQASISEAYVLVENGEVWIHGFHITSGSQAFSIPDPTRPKKLLLHRKEIDKIQKAVDRKGYTLIPVSVETNPKGLIKIKISLALGKTDYDKRQALKEKATRRDEE